MNPAYIVVCVFIAYFLGYRFYARFLSEKLFVLRKDSPTPAHTQNDGVDYVPTSPVILFGHHFASISGLGPILGPAVAVIWGWLPALLWVVFGTILIGAVHDFSALVLSIRSKGYSIGTITEYLMGKRARFLFLIIIFFLVSMAMGVFVLVLGKLFAPGPGGFPQVMTPSMMIILLALVIGYLTYKKGIPIKYLGIPAFFLILTFIWLEESFSLSQISGLQQAMDADSWKKMMLTYAFFASVLPVWLLLQSRDFINSLFLLLGLVALYLGFFSSGAEFSAPMLQISPKNAPPIFPFVFVLIACGSISGFHALVSSGTSAKQLNQEKDAKVIGYGGMIGESLLGLVAILATTTVFATQEAWQEAYGDYHAIGLTQKVGFFIQGGASFLGSLGISNQVATSFIAFVVVSFALTSLDSGTRLLRYNLEEIAEFLRESPIKKILQNRYLTSMMAVAAIAFFAFFKTGNLSVGQILWALFGTTNQLLGALALLIASIYLYSRGKNPLYTLIPMIFLLIATVYAMFAKAHEFITQGANLTLTSISIILIVLTFWLLFEAVAAAIRYKNKKVQSLDIIT